MWFDLKGDARLGRCATDACGGQPRYRLEANGIGSNYCSGCRELIDEGLDAVKDMKTWPADIRHAHGIKVDDEQIVEPKTEG